MAHFWGVLGKLGGWDALGQCSAGSSSVFRCFRAVGRGPEEGRGGDAAVVDGRIVDDVVGRVDA